MYRRVPQAASSGASFAGADITVPPAARYDAIPCRGVLNDIVDDDRRGHRRICPGSSTRRCVFRKRVSTDRGELTFTSVTDLDAERRLLLITERHELVWQGDTRVSDYRFVMRCWERDELGTLLARHGFGNVQYFGAYDHKVALGATDRLVAVAQLADSSDTASVISSRLPAL